MSNEHYLWEIPYCITSSSWPSLPKWQLRELRASQIGATHNYCQREHFVRGGLYWDFQKKNRPGNFDRYFRWRRRVRCKKSQNTKYSTYIICEWSRIALCMDLVDVQGLIWLNDAIPLWECLCARDIFCFPLSVLLECLCSWFWMYCFLFCTLFLSTLLWASFSW